MDDQRCHLDEPQNGEGASNSMSSLNEMIGRLRTALPACVKYICTTNQAFAFSPRSCNYHFPPDRGAV